MPMNLDSVGAVSEPASVRGRRRTRCSTRSASARVRPTRPGSSSSSRPRTRQNVAAARAADDAGGRRDGRRPGLPSWGDFDFRMLLHGEQGVTVHGPIPADGEVESVTQIVGIYDKGKAAVVRLETESTYVDSGKPAFNTRFAAFIRGEGGFGESARRRDRRPAEDARRASPTTRSRTRRVDDQALLYRLSRRPQPAALRPGDREVRRLRPADPARSLHLRRHRPRVAARAVRLRRREVPEHGRALLEAGHARRHAHRAHVGRRHGRGDLPDRHPGRHRRHRRRRLRVPNARNVGDTRSRRRFARRE